MEIMKLSDESLGYGLGVFETMRVENGKVIWMQQHLKRMRESAQRIGIKELERLDELHFEEEIRRAEQQLGEQFVMKLLLTNQQIYIGFRKIIYENTDYENGFRICTSQVRRDENSIWTSIKSLHYGDQILEKRKAQEKGFQEALFLTSRGEIAECTMSNIFWVTQGQIYTPALSCGLLPGIMRAFVIENRSVVEVRATLEQLLNADEVFLTNSVMEIMGVSQIDRKKYGSMDTANEIRKEILLK